jgi:hypothetical protein
MVHRGFSVVLLIVYPFYKWQWWRFKVPPSKAWKKRSMIQLCMDHMATIWTLKTKQSGIKSREHR